MNKFIVLFAAAALLFGLCACTAAQPEQPGAESSQGPTWQEQYDLGLRYLSEGNYEEAVLAFTAAIEIDPKQAPAFVGRGDAYTGIGQLSMAQIEEGAELTQEADLAYHSAVTDYLSAIELDASTPEVYRKAAEAYVLLGDREAAIEILKRGIEATGDESLQEQLDALSQVYDMPEGMSERVTVTGYIIYNPDEYHDTWQAYRDQYVKPGDIIGCAIDTYGMRFENPVVVHFGDELVSIQEALLGGWSDQLNFDSFEDFRNATIGLRMEMTGWFWRLEYAGEVVVPFYNENQQLIGYNYHPNGDYSFFVDNYTLLSE